MKPGQKLSVIARVLGLISPTHVCQRLLGLGHHPSLDHLHGLGYKANLAGNIKSVVDLSRGMVNNHNMSMSQIPDT